MKFRFLIESITFIDSYESEIFAIYGRHRYFFFRVFGYQLLTTLVGKNENEREE